MMRHLSGTLVMLALVVGVALAEDVKGRVKSTDLEKNTITLTVNDKDQTLNVAKDAKFVGLYGKKVKKAKILDIPGGLSGIRAGANVTVTTEKKDDKEVAISVKVEDLQKKKKGT